MGKAKAFITIVAIALFASTSVAFAAISEKQAISTALELIKKEYELTDAEMEEYIFAEAALRPSGVGTGDEWLILFSSVVNHPGFSNDTYAVYLTAEGCLMQIVPPSIRNSVNAAFQEVSHGRGEFVTWTIE